MFRLATISNFILAGSSAYALFYLEPVKNPYAFTACTFALCHGLLGAIQSTWDDDCNKVKEISSSIVDIVLLPIINIELYLRSTQSSSLALGHGLFVIPLAFDIILKLFTDDGEDNDTETLKDLTILGNIISMIFLAVNEDNYLYGIMALTAFLSKFTASIVDNMICGAGYNGITLGQAAFIYLSLIALTQV